MIFGNQRVYLLKNWVKKSKLIRPEYVIFSKDTEFFQQDKSNVIAAKSIVNIYIVYKLSTKNISSSNALKNCLFGATEVKKKTNNTYPQKWQCSRYCLAFDRTGQFTYNDGSLARNIIIFGADLDIQQTKQKTF